MKLTGVPGKIPLFSAGLFVSFFGIIWMEYRENKE